MRRRWCSRGSSARRRDVPAARRRPEARHRRAARASKAAALRAGEQEDPARARQRPRRPWHGSGRRRRRPGSPTGVARPMPSCPVRSAVIKTASLDLRVRHGRFGDGDGRRRPDRARGSAATSAAARRSARSVHDGTLVMRVPGARVRPGPGGRRAARPAHERGRLRTRRHPQLVNLDARLGNLESQQRALRALMRRAVSVSDTIRVQGVLQGVELQMEEIQGELNLPARPHRDVDDLDRRPRGRRTAGAARACDGDLEGGSPRCQCGHRGRQQRDRRRRLRDPDRDPRPAGRARRPARGAVGGTPRRPPARARRRPRPTTERRDAVPSGWA